MNTQHNTTFYRVTLIRSERATLREKLEYPSITEVVITSPDYVSAKAKYDELNTGSEIDKELHAFNESEGFNVLIESTYTQSELNTFDVYFDDDDNSNCKWFYTSFDECYDYIKINNGTNNSYFEDYKGGIVSIVCDNNSTTVYHTEVLQELPIHESNGIVEQSTIDSNRVMVDFTDRVYNMVHSALCNAVSIDYFFGMQIDVDSSIYSDAKKRIKDVDEIICQEDVWMEIIKMGEKLVFDGHKDNTAYLDSVKIKDNFKHVPDYIIGSYLSEYDDAHTGAMLLQYLMFGEAIYG